MNRTQDINNPEFKNSDKYKNALRKLQEFLDAVDMLGRNPSAATETYDFFFKEGNHLFRYTLDTMITECSDEE